MSFTTEWSTGQTGDLGNVGHEKKGDFGIGDDAAFNDFESKFRLDLFLDDGRPDGGIQITWKKIVPYG